MKLIYRYLILLLVISLCSAGCKRKVKLTAEYIDSLNTTFSSLNIAVDSSWKIMMDEDDEKIQNLKNLLEEVSVRQKFNAEAGNELVQRLNSLTGIRYNRQTMTRSKLIDDYDSLTVQLLEDAGNYVHSWPGFHQHPDLVSLDSSIEKMDENVLMQRINYDSHAKLLNNFVKENLEVLKEINPQGDFTPRPLFELGTGSSE
jgi:hypothetical protein